jgi:hypothetical protein
LKSFALLAVMIQIIVFISVGWAILCKIMHQMMPIIKSWFCLIFC